MADVNASGIAGAALGLVQMGVGLAKDAVSKRETKSLLAQRESFKTPSQILDIVNATESNAQSGFDASTLDYLNNQTDQAFASSIASAERMGGDPNTLSTIFAKKIDAIKGVAAQDHQLSMANFSAYINAQNTLAANVAAEQKSRQDILKDKIQASSNNKMIASQQISAGANTELAALSAIQMAKLYGNNNNGGGNNGTVYGGTNTTGYIPSTASSIARTAQDTVIQAPVIQSFQVPQFNFNRPV